MGGEWVVKLNQTEPTYKYKLPERRINADGSVSKDGSTTATSGIQHFSPKILFLKLSQKYT
jgi:hypothetical protein